MKKKKGAPIKINFSGSRKKLKAAIEEAGMKVGEQLVSGSAQDFRNEIWRVVAEIKQHPLEALLDQKIAKAMDRCGVAWYQHSLTVKDPREQRLAERAASTVGFDDALSYEENLSKFD